MYDVYGFGKRIANYRKLAGLTQEELARRLNITAQAVSKWENEISFPEITVLPLIAKELSTSIEKLFGNEAVISSNISKQDTLKNTFPDKKGPNLKLVHTYKSVACYSNKEITLTNKDSVVFTDGSNANLRTLQVVNKGSGDIEFDFADERLFQADFSHGETFLEKTFDGISSLQIDVVNANYRITRAKDNTTSISATGTPIFIKSLMINKKRDLLSIGYDNSIRGNEQRSNNKVEIAFGQDLGEELHIAVNGSGSINVAVPFKKGRNSINGSGNMELISVDQLNHEINGSGNMSCQKSVTTTAEINGSGNLRVLEVSERYSGEINGSGNMMIGGIMDKFKINICGSGNIKAENVTTNTAELSIDGSGKIALGRVIKESIEKHSKHGSIKVLKRG